MQDSASLYASNRSHLWIETIKGRPFYFENPVFDIEEIAWALSLQCRYTGHCNRFYSVAQHSLLVSRLCERLGYGDPFEGLLHDAQEAYLSDVNAPAKAMIPDYRKLEGSLETALRKQYGLAGEKTSDDVKRADWLALFIEANTLLPSKGRGWEAPPGIIDEARTLCAQGWEPSILEPTAARKEFLYRHRVLADARP